MVHLVSHPQKHLVNLPEGKEAIADHQNMNHSRFYGMANMFRKLRFLPWERFSGALVTARVYSSS